MRLEEAGVIWTNPKQCAPLEQVAVTFRWNGLTGQDVRIEIEDADHRQYFEKTFRSQAGQAQTTIQPGGKPGVHHIRVHTTAPDGRPYTRHGGFRVVCATALRTDDAETDDLFAHLAEGLRQGIDITRVDGKPITQYKHADNVRQNLCYPVYAIEALRYFIQDVKSMFEVQFAYQYPDGSLPDHIYGDGFPCPLTGRRLRSCMADLEVGAASTMFKAWQAHGDHEWLNRLMPKLEACLEYATSHPAIWDEAHGLIKRPHSLDEWDIQFSPKGSSSNVITKESVYVLMQGDTSQLCAACEAMASLCEATERHERADHWRVRRQHFRALGNRLFWDGVKYRHHIHLDEFDHGEFNEDDQLTMSNAFALNRGFADHEQAISIIEEYMRRWKTTGDRFPWWSLQPGYPDSLKYFEGLDKWKRGQGNYANGGLFPWVGGELCKGAFAHGKEAFAWTLLRDFHEVLKRDNGAVFTWYDLQGHAAISSTHSQTNYDPWGFFAWSQAMIEGLAGIQPQGRCFDEVVCSPRWPVTGGREITATAHFPASDTYFAYQYARRDDEIAIRFAGTGRSVRFRILLPSDANCRRVTIDGEPAGFSTEQIENSCYIVTKSDIRGSRDVVFALQ